MRHLHPEIYQKKNFFFYFNFFIFIDDSSLTWAKIMKNNYNYEYLVVVNNT